MRDLNKKISDQVVRNIKDKYRSKQGTMGFVALNKTIHDMTPKHRSGGKNQKWRFYIRDQVSPFLLTKNSKSKVKKVRRGRSKSRAYRLRYSRMHYRRTRGLLK